MFSMIRSIVAVAAASLLDRVRPGVDGIVGKLDKTVADLDSFVEREQAKRLRSYERCFAMQKRMDAEHGLRDASRNASDRAKRVRERVSRLIA